MMFNTDFPQPLGSSVVRKLETNRTFKLFILEKTTREAVRNVEHEKWVYSLLQVKNNLFNKLEISYSISNFPK